MAFLTSRRRFLMFAAPAIVAAPALMKISTAFLMPEQPWDIDAMAAEAERRIVEAIRFGRSGPRNPIQFVGSEERSGFDVAYLPNPWRGMPIKEEEQWH